MLLALLLVATKLIQPDFGVSGLDSLARAALPFALATLGMAVVVIAGGIDLSMAAMMAVASVTAAVLMDGASDGQAALLSLFVLALGRGDGGDQRRADRADTGARYRGDAGDAVRLAGRGAADPECAGRWRGTLAARADRGRCDAARPAGGVDRMAAESGGVFAGRVWR